MCFREKGDLGDKDKSVDLQLSPYQSMRGLGSEELDLEKNNSLKGLSDKIKTTNGWKW